MSLSSSPSPHIGCIGGQRAWWFMREAVQSGSQGCVGLLWETVSWKVGARRPLFLGSFVSTGMGKGAWLVVSWLTQEAHLWNRHIVKDCGNHLHLCWGSCGTPQHTLQSGWSWHTAPMIDRMHILVAATNQSISWSCKGWCYTTHLDQECTGEWDKNSLQFGPMSNVNSCARVRQEE